MKAGSGTVLQVFSEVDTSGDGCISYDEFQKVRLQRACVVRLCDLNTFVVASYQVLAKLKMEYSKEQVTRLAQVCVCACDGVFVYSCVSLGMFH